MKFIAYSDPHNHPHQSYSKILPDGMNSRLVDIGRAVKTIYDAAEEIGCPVVSGGDTFQVKNSAHVIAFNEFSGILHRRSKVANPDQFDIINIGNHDMATHDGSRHALESLSYLPGIFIPHGASVSFAHWGEGIMFAIIPYPMEHGRFSEDKFRGMLKRAIEEVENAKPYTAILLGHLYTHELMKKHLDRGGDFSGKELMKHFDLVLLGHHHVHDVILGPTDKHGRTKKVVSIGSPIQLRADERGDKKGYIIVNTETLDFEFIPIESPEFHYFEGEKTIVPEKITGDFVSVKVKSKAEGTRVKTLLERHGVAEYRIEVVPEKKTARIDLTPGAKDEEIITKYLESEWGKTDLDHDRLKKIGLAYLS
ncbi:uncharacterized protein Dvar_40770 [Desulfosarcina variabilis str. Montpellier]|uniref:hypothetical protein n=1 Tax=Desulfosarcina variabilis TaxID=2300 RepID=UPI003AFA3B50